MSIDRKRRRPAPALRRRLLVAVNLTLGAVLLGLMAVEYAVESRRHVRDRESELRGEAGATVVALQRLRQDGPAAIQAYLDLACARAEPAASPGHHVTAVVGTVEYRASSHAGGPPPGEDVIAASDRDGDVTARVADLAAPLVRESRRRALWHLPSLLITGAFVSGVLNLILLRLVTRPLGDLARRVRAIGQGRLDSGERAAERSFGNNEMDAMAREVAAMSRALARAEADRRQSMQRARRIQEHLRPVMPRLDGLSFAARYQPADAVGGDYYDVRAAPDGSIVLCVADVSGHGVSAALGAAILKALFTGVVARTSDPCEILSAMHRGFASVSLYEDFATMAVAVVAPGGTELRFASAGHEPGYLLDPSGAARPLETTGPILGIDELVGPTANWAVRRLQVEPGSRLILLTDGFAEAPSPGGDLLGRDPIHTAAAGLRGEPIERLADALVADVLRWTAGAAPTDDLTLLVVEWRPAD